MNWRDFHSLDVGLSSPDAATLNGTPLSPCGLSPNPYRSGRWLIDATHFDSLLKPDRNLIEVTL